MNYLKYKIQKHIHQIFNKPSIYKTFALAVISENVETEKNSYHHIDIRGIINIDGSQSTIYYPWQDLDYETTDYNILSIFENGWIHTLELGEAVVKFTSKIDPLLSVEFKVKVIDKKEDNNGQ